MKPSNIAAETTAAKRTVKPAVKLAIGGIVTAIVITACASLPTTAANNICSVFNVKSGWHHSAKSMQAKWDIPLHVPMAMMYHESKFRRKAKPPRRYLLGFIPWKRRSSAYGYAQAVDGTWSTYQRDTRNRGARRTDFDDALDFMGWYIDRSSRVNGISKRDAYRQYLAYHEGWTGYKQRSYEKKQWLQRVASNVDQLSKRYEAQYAGCKNNLNRGFLRRWFS
jgi:hypothetical protein